MRYRGTGPSRRSSWPAGRARIVVRVFPAARRRGIGRPDLLWFATSGCGTVGAAALPGIRTRRDGIRNAIALTGAALAIALAAGASPAVSLAPLGVQDDRLNSRGEELVDRLDLLKASRAKVTRHDVLWANVAPTRPKDPTDPRDPAYRFERLDAVVRGLDERGIVPILVVYNTPTWAADQLGRRAGGSNPDARAPDPGHFAAFMRAVAARYNGNFVVRRGDDPLPEVRHWELWNEPNLGAFLSPQYVSGRPTGLRHYIRMVSRAYPAIRRVNRDAVIIAGVGGPRSSTTSTGTGALAWARGLAHSNARFDAYSQHVYPSQPPRATTRANLNAFPTWATLPRLFDTLDEVPRRRGMPVYVTEAGYTTARTPYRAVSFTPTEQARYLRQMANMPVARSPRLKAIIWFNLQDNPSWPSGLLTSREGVRIGVTRSTERGVVAASGKPSWNAFRRIAGARPLPADLQPVR